MEERRGLVVERSFNRMTAITKNGEFVTWKDRRDLMPGEEVTIPSLRFEGFVWRKLVPATVLAVVLVFMSFFGYQQYLYARPTMAYVTFDSAGESSGSVELEVNDRGLVKSATGLDEAGADALNDIDCEMKPVQVVLASLNEALQKNGEVVVAFIPIEEEDDDFDSTPASNNNGKSKEHKLAALEKRVLGAIEKANGITLDLKTRDEARELGISAGRAASWALSKNKPDDKADKDDPGTATSPDDNSPPSEPGESDDPPANEPGHHGSSGSETQSGPQNQPNHDGPQGHTKNWPDDDNPTSSPDDDEIETLLNEIRGKLPGFDLEKLAGKDAKELRKYLDTVTREWLKLVKDMAENKGVSTDGQGSGNGLGGSGSGR